MAIFGGTAYWSCSSLGAGCGWSDKAPAGLQYAATTPLFATIDVTDPLIEDESAE